MKYRCVKRALRLAVILAAGIGGPAFAADFEELFTFDPGQACSFALKIESDGWGVRVNHDLTHGKWRTINAGTGSNIRLTNVSNGKRFTLRGSGAVGHFEAPGANGSTVATFTGHVIQIMFPTDTPGPSATLYVGTFTISNDALGNTTLLSSSGRAIDLCAALSD